MFFECLKVDARDVQTFGECLISCENRTLLNWLNKGKAERLWRTLIVGTMFVMFYFCMSFAVNSIQFTCSGRCRHPGGEGMSAPEQTGGNGGVRMNTFQWSSGHATPSEANCLLQGGLEGCFLVRVDFLVVQQLFPLDD